MSGTIPAFPARFPSPRPIPLVEIDGSEPLERGRQRGRATAAEARATIDGYRALFHAGGLDDARLAADAQIVLDVVEDVLPDLHAELRGMAEESGIPIEDLALVNARTEVLGGGGSRECSTVVGIRGGVASVQTWDWHAEFQDGWHRHHVAGTPYTFVGMTEYGILGKVGINSAGLGLHLNILGHADDGVGGAPVHLLITQVLGCTGSVAEAVDLVRSMPIRSSSTVTLVDPEGAVTLELSPGRVDELRPSDGGLLHTNHFLAPEPAAGEKTYLYQPDSTDRMRLLRERIADGGVPSGVDALVPLLRSGPGEPELCVFPNESLPFGERWGTLATIAFEPERRTMRITRELPSTLRHDSWITMTAA